MLRFKLDDPTDAVSIHGLGGLLGLVLGPLFRNRYGVFASSFSQSSLICLGWNLVGILCLIAWALTLSLVIFGPLAFFSKLGKVDSCEENVEMREIAAYQKGK